MSFRSVEVAPCSEDDDTADVDESTHTITLGASRQAPDVPGHAGQSSPTRVREPQARLLHGPTPGRLTGQDRDEERE
jgi:hypothetical protein